MREHLRPAIKACLALWVVLLAIRPDPSFSAPRPPAGHGAMVDALGDTLQAGPYPERIVSLSPNLTETLFALGVSPDRIVGVTRYCDFPPAARSRPIIGGILDPSLERIQMQHPDLVLAARGNPVETLRRIRSLGIPVFAFDDRTGFEGILSMVGDLTSLVGPDDRQAALDLRARFVQARERYQAWSDSIPEREKPTVYYADPGYPSWTAGIGSHIDDLIRLAGGRNVVSGAGWPQFSAEMLLQANPERFLLALPAGEDTATIVSGLHGTPGWSRLANLRPGRICWIESGRLQRPGPRLPAALEALASCLHPERPKPEAAP